MADPILKMAGLKLFYDNCFIRKWFLKSGYQCWMPQTISKVKDDFEVINQLIYIVIMNSFNVKNLQISLR